MTEKTAKGISGGRVGKNSVEMDGCAFSSIDELKLIPINPCNRDARERARDTYAGTHKVTGPLQQMRFGGESPNEKICL